MTSLLSKIPCFIGVAGNIGTRAVLEVAGVAAIPYWMKQAGVLDEEVAFYAALGAFSLAATRFTASFFTKSLKNRVQRDPNSLGGYAAHFLYGLATGKSALGKSVLPVSIGDVKSAVNVTVLDIRNYPLSSSRQSSAV